MDPESVELVLELKPLHPVKVSTQTVLYRFLGLVSTRVGHPRAQLLSISTTDHRRPHFFRRGVDVLAGQLCERAAGGGGGRFSLLDSGCVAATF